VTPLHALPNGARGRLVAVGGERAFRRRLLELGLLPGTAIRVVRRVDVGGLIEIEVAGGFLSLRRTEAAALAVATAEG
jgi:ferrous iron transport protein A